MGQVLIQEIFLTLGKTMVRERVQMIKQCNIMARTECTALKWTGRKLENN